MVTDEPEVPLDADGDAKPPVTRVVLEREGATVSLAVENASTACVTVNGRRPFKVALSRRTTVDCLAEELRHLDPDTAYARALRGLSRVRRVTDSLSDAVEPAPVPNDPEESTR